MTRALQSIRSRATIGASLVSLAAFMIAGIALVVFVRHNQIGTVDAGLRLRATDIESLIDGGATPASVAVESEDTSFVQILDTPGEVVATSANLTGEPAVSDATTSSFSTQHVEALDAGEYRVYTQQTDSGDRLRIVVGTSLENIAETQETLVVALVVGIPLLTLLIGALTWIVVGRSLRPVDDIRRRVDDIDAHQLDQRVPVPDTDDEIERLATTMNRMLDRIQESQRRQAQFVSDASHELRTPIAIIRHELEVSLANGDADVWRVTAADVLEENLRMQRLVDDLLFIARQDQRGDQADTHPADRHALIDIDDLVIVESARHRSGVPIDLAGVSAGQVRGDLDQLARVIANLLDNARRHADSTVAVHVKSDGDTVVIHVDDDGSGIDEVDRERVFERFARTDESRARDLGGTGLGLAIARDIVTNHDGTIEATTSPWLGGARFTVTLPNARS